MQTKFVFVLGLQVFKSLNKIINKILQITIYLMNIFEWIQMVRILRLKNKTNKNKNY